MRAMANGEEEAIRGLEAIEKVFTYLEHLPLHNTLKFDVTLARGLGYYTGCIFEVAALDAELGSLGGGGRYDDLTGAFGWSGVPGVGISFGAERIYDVLEAKELFPANLQKGPKVLFAAIDDESLAFAFACVSELRKAGIPTDLYPEPGKLKKPFKYADEIGCAYIAIIGQEEVENSLIQLKDLVSGKQLAVSIQEAINFLKPAL